jgi:alpha-glucosidase
MSQSSSKSTALAKQSAAPVARVSAPADSYQFVNVNAFTPNDGGWTSFGNVASHSRSGNVFTLTAAENAVSCQLSFLSPTCFRVRFNPTPRFDYSVETSVAVVNRALGPVSLKVLQDDDQAIVVDTGAMKVEIQLQPYRVLVYRGNQLINADEPGKNLVYIPGQEVIANLKVYPGGARYCGFGEKAGAQVLKNEFTMTFFNYDNFMYSSGPVPPNNEGGPLNPSEALYCSVPLLLENNPAPQGDYAGKAYSYGIFFDNPAQSYFNIGASDYSDMRGKYYFGALYGDMDYYFMAGDDTAGVLQQYTALTGRPTMPPKYVFGYHQGCYGYYNRDILEGVAKAYRSARIPIDGLHIDVDFQNNYRTFTSSELKFPNAPQMMAGLHQLGFKCSTNITPLLTDNTLDENNKETPYTQRDALRSVNGLIYNTRANEGPSPDLYVGQVSYGVNQGTNPYPYPPLVQESSGMPLGAPGYYPDFGRADVRKVWGEQYSHLIQTVDMDMVWQDMTCPAIAKSGDSPYQTFPLSMETNNGTTYVPNAKMHNAYVLLLLQATWEGINVLRPDRRNFIIARGGYAGMQRYAGLWTGDSASSWDFLRINIPEVLNLGLSGIPISGCDIGGFANGSGSTTNYQIVGTPFQGAHVEGGITDYELLTRWMQAGSFLPWYRNHYDGYTKQFQEPYAYGEPVPTHCRTFVELRYRMLQLYYDAMYQATQTGLPIARALFLNDGQDARVYQYLDDQFFIGRDFLVAPVTTPGTGSPPVATRSVYLPAGSQWYAFKDNKAPLDAPVEGGTLIENWVADLGQVPIYVRAGAILPFRELEQYVGELSENPLTFNIYPGADSTYSLYQDDGVTTEAELEKAYRCTEVSHQGIPGGQKVRVRRVYDRYTPAERFYYVALLGTRAPSSITLGDTTLPDAGDANSLAGSQQNAWYWNASLQTTFIKLFDTQPDVTVTAMYL